MRSKDAQKQLARTSLSTFATQPVSYGLRFAKELAQNPDCVTTDHSKMVACIRSKKGEEIQNASTLTDYQFYSYLRWAPIVDENFLVDTTRNHRDKGNFKKLKLMIGFNSQEGGAFLGPYARSTFGLTENVDNGVSTPFFKKFVTKFSQTRNNR